MYLCSIHLLICGGDREKFDANLFTNVDIVYRSNKRAGTHCADDELEIEFGDKAGGGNCVVDIAFVRVRHISRVRRQSDRS